MIDYKFTIKWTKDKYKNITCSNSCSFNSYEYGCRINCSNEFRQPIKCQEGIYSLVKVDINMKVVYGYDIGSYATAPNHENLVKQVYESIQKRGLENYLNKYCSKSPITLEMILNSSQKHNVDPIMVAAIMQVDSNMGTKGLGSKTMNPGNVWVS